MVSISHKSDGIHTVCLPAHGVGAQLTPLRLNGCGMVDLARHPDTPSAPTVTAAAAREAWAHAVRYPSWHRRRHEFAAAAKELDRLSERDAAADRRRRSMEVAR